MAWPITLSTITISAGPHVTRLARRNLSEHGCSGERTLGEERRRSGGDQDQPKRADPYSRNKHARHGKPDDKDLCRAVNCSLLGACMTSPGAGYSMGDRFMVMLMLGGLSIRRRTGARHKSGEEIEQHARERQRSHTGVHGAISRRCRMKPMASGPSHSRGPTARPATVPFFAIKTVVGSPRTMNAKVTSRSSSSNTGSVE